MIYTLLMDGLVIGNIVCQQDDLWAVRQQVRRFAELNGQSSDFFDERMEE